MTCVVDDYIPATIIDCVRFWLRNPHKHFPPFQLHAAFFSGDSITNLMAITLVSVLRATSEPVQSYYQLSNARKWGACNGEVKVAFYRNDFLDTTTWPNAFWDGFCDMRSPKRNAQCEVFADDETLKGYDTVIINSGAHPRSLDEYRETMETARNELTASMKRLHGDDALLIVRNTPPGHGGCTERSVGEITKIEKVRTQENKAYGTIRRPNWSCISLKVVLSTSFKSTCIVVLNNSMRGVQDVSIEAR